MTADATSRHRSQLTRAADRATGRRYCSSCCSDKPMEGGIDKVQANGRTRWVCAGCVQRWTRWGKG